MALGSIPAGEASHSPRASRHRQGGEQNSWSREEGAPAAGRALRWPCLPGALVGRSAGRGSRCSAHLPLCHPQGVSPGWEGGTQRVPATCRGSPGRMYLDWSLLQGSCSDSAVPSRKNVYSSLPPPQVLPGETAPRKETQVGIPGFTGTCGSRAPQSIPVAVWS